MFSGRCSLTLSLTLSTWIFLRTEALSFYKVPFVVCFCIRLLLSQDRLPSVQYSGGAFSRRPPCAPPQTSPACHSPLPFHSGAHETTPAASPRREGHNQGRLSDIITQRNGLKRANKSCCGGRQPSSPRTCSVWLFTKHHLSTRPQRHADVVCDHFYTCGGFYNFSGECLPFLCGLTSLGAFMLRRLPALYGFVLLSPQCKAYVGMIWLVRQCKKVELETTRIKGTRERFLFFFFFFFLSPWTFPFFIGQRNY